MPFDAFETPPRVIEKTCRACVNMVRRETDRLEMHHAERIIAERIIAEMVALSNTSGWP